MRLLAAITIPMAVGPCVVEQAIVTMVPPTSAHVLIVSDCPERRCWTKWVEVDGRRIGEGRVCSISSSSQSGDRFEAAPTVAP